jgi:hypothetical protein
MARHASTYRQARRQAWLNNSPTMTWAEFNAMLVGTHGGNYTYGEPGMARYVSKPDRSKYVPHIGAKQRVKGAK